MNRTMDSKITPEGAVGGKREKNQNIQVFVRVRPMSNQEIAKHTTEVIDTPGNREVVVKERAVSTVTKTFTFDKVFGPRSKQPDVYKTVVAPLLAEVLLGYNCTVFAYGQTGTGKTFTMEGDRSQSKYNIDQSVCVENDPSAGILPRALSHLFDEVRLMECEWTVRVSFLELYNEELFDLLAPIEDLKHRTLRLFDDGHRKGSVVIQGLEEVIVTNKHEVYSILERGSQQRRTAATLLNASSSRSHTIFTITVHMRENSVDSEEMIKIGKLHLVDLAGSENIGKSGAVDKRAREAGSINQSLLTLGRVISALVERTPHVPYRESKLTRLLQDSLGGRTKTSIIATISPAALNIEETLSTLEYAHRAKNIMNRPEVNQKLTKREALSIYSDEIDRLRRDLNATREKNGMFMDMDNYNRMMAQIESQRHELNEKSSKIRDLEENIVEKEEEHRQTLEKISELHMDLQAKQAIIEDIKMRKQQTEEELEKSKRLNDELNYVVDTHVTTEEKLSNEANVLLNTATDTVSIIEALHTRLDRKQQVEERNWKNGERFREDCRKYVDDLIKTVNEIRENHTINASNIRHVMKTRTKNWKIEAQNFQKKVSRASQSVAEISQALSKICGKNEPLTTDQKITTEEAATKESEMPEMSETLRERTYKDLTMVINDIRKIERALEKTKTDMENLSREISSRVSIMADESMAIIDKTKEFQKDLTEDFQEHVNVQCDEITNGSAIVTSMLQHVAGNVDEFWEQTYLSDSPTGATPSRRKYDFPTKLSATSPHDRIINRYRRLKTDVQVTIDEAGEGDHSDSDIPTSA